MSLKPQTLKAAYWRSSASSRIMFLLAIQTALLPEEFSSATHRKPWDGLSAVVLACTLCNGPMQLVCSSMWVYSRWMESASGVYVSAHGLSTATVSSVQHPIEY